MIDKYVNWVSYWDNEIDCQIQSLEDYEPTLIKTDCSHIRMLMDIDDKELIINDCEIRDDGCLIVWEFGTDEDGFSLTFLIGKDDLIKHVEFY